jgi:hypothetical protein
LPDELAERLRIEALTRGVGILEEAESKSLESGRGFRHGSAA